MSETLNWLGVHKSESNNNNRVVIVSLDLQTETYKQLLLPHEEATLEADCVALGVMRKSLCFFHEYKRTHFIMWQMKEFGDEKSWTRLMKIQLGASIFTPGAGMFTLSPLCISENGDVVMLKNYRNSEVILYHTRDDRVEHIEVLKYIHMNTKDYVESLCVEKNFKHNSDAGFFVPPSLFKE
ncbi:hypothetical protein RIF29_35273 [Crotalaria pallida]|uniref:F-box associated beta-propeller type 1 domain-containing protein n=1 Tax=Crotalaria pallida TaxID=3830 RepID=A0AAN9E9R2_CROPI